MTVRLPLTQQQPVSAMPEEENNLMENLTILIVEDNKDSREMLAQLLRLDDYKVLEASDGIQGFAMIEQHQPDLAFVDVGLPKMNGCDLARKVTQAGLSTALVALTGYGRDEDRKAALEAGFTQHLVKPLTPECLYDTLKKFAAKKRNEQNGSPSL
jgi:CheY-like chemotaxis protein